MAEALASYAPAAVGRPRLDAEALFRRNDALKGQSSLFQFDWQEIVNLMIPGAQDILTWKAPGDSRMQYIFDTTGVMAPQTLAANIQGAVTNPALQWFRYRFRAEDLNQYQHVNGWLEACDEITLATYAGSNFYHAAHTYYLNLGSFGTAAMLIASRRHSLGVHLQFKTLPTGSYRIAENSDGRVDTLFRDCWFTPRQALQEFGKGVSTRTIERSKEAHLMDKPEPYLHAVYPREERQGGRLDNRNMPWIDCYLECETKTVVKEAGFEEFPYVVSRWETLSTSPYGFGPGHMALPDVRVLNKLRELNLEQLVLWARPPLTMLREGVIGNVSLEGYALNVITQQDALKTLELTGRPDLVQLNQTELKQSIKDIFFVDALQGLPPPDVAKMTAFEVAQRIEQMQRLMGPAFTRLLNEMLDPLADRVFGLLLRARAFPPPPMEVLEAAMQQRGQLDVVYQGPLARSQKGSDVRAIGDMVQMGSQMVGATQNFAIWDNADMDEAFRHAATISGVPQSLIRDAQDVVRMRKARQQAQDEAQQAQGMRDDAQAVGQIAPALKIYQEGQQQQPARAA